MLASIYIWYDYCECQVNSVIFSLKTLLLHSNNLYIISNYATIITTTLPLLLLQQEVAFVIFFSLLSLCIGVSYHDNFYYLTDL